MSMGDLGSSTFHVTADVAPFEAGMRRAQATTRRTTQVMDGELGALSGKATRRLDEVGRAFERVAAKGRSGFSNTGLGLMAIGNAVDDMQYGFRSVVNNIPQIVYMMGGSAGLAGGAAIAAVAVNQLIQRWGQMSDALQGAWLNVPASGLEKLRITAEKAEEALAKLMATPSKFETRQINALTDAMTEAGPGGARSVFKGLSEAVAASPVDSVKMSDEQRQRLARARAHAAEPELGVGAAGLMGVDPKKEKAERVARVAQLEREIAQEIGVATAAKVADIMGKSILGGEEGAAARMTLQRLVKQFPNSFPEKFRKDLEGTTDTAVEHEEGNRRVARALMKGPMGAQMLMGAGAEKVRTPMTDDQIRGLLDNTRMHLRLGGLEKDTMFKALKDAGLSEEQGRGVMGGMRTKDVLAFAKKAGVGVRDAIPRMFDERMQAAKAGVGGFEKDIRRKIKDSGIEADEPGVLREMRQINKERVQAVMFEKDLTKKQAEQYLLRERAHQLEGAARGGQWVGLTQFAHMAAEQQRMPDLAQKQLDELGQIRKVLKEQADKRGDAMAAGLAAGGAANAAVAAFPG